eukprot:3107475-Ditylum_brightwellii.AAC.1
MEVISMAALEPLNSQVTQGLRGGDKPHRHKAPYDDESITALMRYQTAHLAHREKFLMFTG